MLLGMGVLGVIIAAATYPIASSLSAGGGAEGTGQVETLLKQTSDRLMVSDTAKRIAYRQQDREVLRRAVREDIEKGDFDAAVLIVDELSSTYGYREEAEQYRDQILAARASSQEQRISQAVTTVEELLAMKEWDKSRAEVDKLQRLFPDSVRIRELPQRVKDSFEQYKHDLERSFLEASERDDVDQAMQLLKELDLYLTEREAEPFRETARGVIGKARENLGVQFKIAVHDREWIRAVRVGEQIIREFPNTKMSEEVRSRLDLLRERAAGEQAAREHETV